MISEKQRTILPRMALIIYLCFILYITIFGRTSNLLYQYEIIPFWSYLELIRGNVSIGKEILLNVLLFVPLGFFFDKVVKLKNQKKRVIVVIIAGMLLSAMIEVVQLTFKLGLAEFDDVFNNVLGIVLGLILSHILYQISELSKDKRIAWLPSIIMILFIIEGFFGCILIWRNESNIILEQQYDFQLESVVYGEDLILIGHCFAFGQPAKKSEYIITLKSLSDGSTYDLDTEIGIQRSDVNDYYSCEYDYTNSGFKAQINESQISYDDEYEVFVNWEKAGLKASGTFIKGTAIEQVSSINATKLDSSDTDLVDIVNSGHLVVCEPEYSCCVYQYDGSLYWITDDDFNYEKEGSTYIEYLLWTTQTKNLPDDRVEYGFDNLRFIFEDYEITGQIDCGKYRVAKYEIPQEYSITYIVTGYYKDGVWIWQDYFRPMLELENS